MTDQDQQNKKTEPEEESKTEVKPVATGKKLVLVAEDDKYYANIYRTKLTKEGYQVVIAKNGEEALKAAQERKPALILLDLVMPVMDGFEALKQLKADVNLKSVKVVVLSNLGQDEDVKKAKALGAVDYLIKTNLSITEMMNKVKSYLA